MFTQAPKGMRVNATHGEWEWGANSLKVILIQPNPTHFIISQMIGRVVSQAL